MDLMNAMDVVRTELKCVQSTDCNHDCGSCGLSMDQSRIVSALTFVLDLLHHEEHKMQHRQHELGYCIAPSIQEAPFASIEFRPVCSHCHEVIYSEVSIEGSYVFPNQCPICGYPIDSVRMPIRLPVSAETYL